MRKWILLLIVGLMLLTQVIYADVRVTEYYIFKSTKLIEFMDKYNINNVTDINNNIFDNALFKGYCKNNVYFYLKSNNMQYRFEVWNDMKSLNYKISIYDSHDKNNIMLYSQIKFTKEFLVNMVKKNWKKDKYVVIFRNFDSKK